MLSSGSRVLLRQRLAPLSLVSFVLLARVAVAQTPPAAAPPPPPAAAPPPSATQSATTLPAPPADLPKSRTQTELEARLQAMRSGRGLTSDDVARRSVKNSPAIEAKRHALEGVDHALDQTKYAYWPRVKLGAAYTRLSPIDVPPQYAGLFTVPENSYVFDAQLAVPISDYFLRVSHAVAGASRAREAADYDRGATVASVSRDARVAYYSWVRAQAQELIAAQAIEQATGHQKDAQNAFQAGLVSKADVLGTQARVKNAELFGERARNQTELARLALEVAMGDTEAKHYEVGEDVFAPSPELQSLPQSAAALREATERRLELKSLDAAARASREQGSLARIGDYPRLDGQAGLVYAQPNPRVFPAQERFDLTWQAGVALTWTPTDIGLSQASGAVADAKAAELSAQRRMLLNGLRLEIEQSLKAAEEARFTIDVSGHSLAAAEEAYRVRRELFRAGRATLVEVTDAETELTRARLELADAFVNSRIALAQLHHALGRDVPPSAKPAR